MNDISIPNALLPPGIITPGAFIADKQPDLPDYGVDSGDLVIVDSGAKFVNGELSAFQSKKAEGYRLSKEQIGGYIHFGKVVMVIKYYDDSPFQWQI